MHFTEGTLLGLSTGVVCLAYCGPVLIPFLMGEGQAVGRNVLMVVTFLSGRLVAYLFTGILAGAAGTILFQNDFSRSVVTGILFIGMSVMLVAYAFHRFRHICLGEAENRLLTGTSRKWPNAIPFTGGVVSGINLCPPFILAITQAAAVRDIPGSMLFFMAFFLGTSVYFIPLPFIGFFRRREVLQIIGKFAAGIAGLYYFFRGLSIVIAYLTHHP